MTWETVLKLKREYSVSAEEMIDMIDFVSVISFEIRVDSSFFAMKPITDTDTAIAILIATRFSKKLARLRFLIQGTSFPFLDFI